VDTSFFQLCDVLFERVEVRKVQTVVVTNVTSMIDVDRCDRQLRHELVRSCSASNYSTTPPLLYLDPLSTVFIRASRPSSQHVLHAGAGRPSIYACCAT